MTASEKLTNAKLRLGLTATTDDTLLTRYLVDSEYFILGITGQPTLPIALEGAQIDLACQYYSKRGAEGEASHGEGGVSVTYESLSPALQLLLRSYTLARVVDMNAEP